MSGMVEVLHGLKVPYGGREDGFIYIDANAAHAIAKELSDAGFGPAPKPVAATEAHWKEAAEMVDYEMDFGEPDPVVVQMAYTEANLREAKAAALEEAAKAIDDFGDGELDEGLTTMWLRKRAAAVRG